jgi:hypothetical protein
VRLIVEVQDLPSGRAVPHSVASYVRAVLTLRALRRELATAAIEVARRKKVIANRQGAPFLLRDAEALLRELGVDADVQ